MREVFFSRLFLFLRYLVTFSDRVSCFFCGRSPKLCCYCWLFRAWCVGFYKFLGSVTIRDYRFGVWEWKR